MSNNFAVQAEKDWWRVSRARSENLSVARELEWESLELAKGLDLLEGNSEYADLFLELEGKLEQIRKKLDVLAVERESLGLDLRVCGARMEKVEGY